MIGLQGSWIHLNLSKRQSTREGKRGIVATVVRHPCLQIPAAASSALSTLSANLPAASSAKPTSVV
jgi:hypothetical protein